ncbi:Uncharacterised protein [Mycobacteroides abscessus subsp. massiliense]|nr:Uncharacterised protein [Mycobacteroides abscessus subsp. massiliense]
MRKHRGIVDQVTRREVVGTVKDQVVLLKELDRIFRIQTQLMQPHLDQRVDLQHRIARALRLGPADIGLAVDDLALQVGLVDHIELDDADGADTRSGQVQQRRGSQPAGADDEHLGVLEAFLPVHTQVGNDQMPAVPGDFFAGQFRGGTYQRRQCGHRDS